MIRKPDTLTGEHRPTASDVIKSSPEDAGARHAALDTGQSFIVKAPAGSGKTELLTSRFLKLLSEVDSPEQILAITFTRAATAEMRSRILSELERARALPDPLSEEDGKLTLARKALHHAEHQGWNLLEQPQRLRIETIDSFCSSLARQTPLLSRLGGELNPTEDAAPLYRLAARRTLQHIGGEDAQLSAAIRALLLLRDNNFAGCESLLARMLAQRDQWSIALAGSAWDPSQDQSLRRRLEAPFQRAIRKAFSQASSLFRRAPGAAEELLTLARFACSNLRGPDHQRHPSHLNNICALEELSALPGTTIDQQETWNSITNFLLPMEGKWRGRPNKSTGFPISSTSMKDRFDALRDQLDNTSGMLDALCEIRSLPPAHFTEEQWQLLRHFFTALHRADAELSIAFAERNEIDFVELGIAAGRVLEPLDAEAPATPGSSGRARDDQLKHLLVDEFQDISRRQHRLIHQLVRGWKSGDGRTCFVVGDPMQSIYLFRQAEVELFQLTYAQGLYAGEGVFPLSALELTKNFRSDRKLVEPLNFAFSKIFSAGSNLSIQVPFTRAEATRRGGNQRSYHVHADFVMEGEECARLTEEARGREAQQMLRIIGEHLPAIDAAAASGGEYRVAILARAKKHLGHLARILNDAGVRYRAVEMEQLGDRQEVLDVISLVRALLHPMDRLAWLSILRAPWCGLQLADLHQLCGADDDRFRDIPVPQLLRERTALLSPQGRMRAERLGAILQRAAVLRSEQLSMPSFAGLVERVWYSLGGPKCQDPTIRDETRRENVELFFKMLSDLPRGEIDCLGEELPRRLEKLCAQPDPGTNERCGVVLMTIHKAKGLGFEVVLVPALERQTGSNDSELLSWLERTVPAGEPDAGEAEILVAAIGSKGENSDALKTWVDRERRAREGEERKRLLYVACTRARKELHLFGMATIKNKEGRKSPGSVLTPGGSASLLKTGWPAFESLFRKAFEERRRMEEEAARKESIMLPFPGPMMIDLAASADEPPRTMLRRLKAADLGATFPPNVSAAEISVAETSLKLRAEAQLPKTRLARPQGTMLARAFGSVVHSMLERLTRLLVRSSVEDARIQVAGWKQQVTTLLLQHGLDVAAARAQSERAIRALQSILDDPEGRWVLAPHESAETEAQWMGVLEGSLRKLRADRLFRAGRAPGQPGDDCFWIIDYKTSEFSAGVLEDFLARQKVEYEQQLRAYAQVVKLHYGLGHGEKHSDGDPEVNVGLYYPLLKRLIWWPMK